MVKEMKDLGFGQGFGHGAHLAAGAQTQERPARSNPAGRLVISFTLTFSGQWGTRESFPVALGVPTLP